MLNKISLFFFCRGGGLKQNKKKHTHPFLSSGYRYTPASVARSALSCSGHALGGHLLANGSMYLYYNIKIQYTALLLNTQKRHKQQRDVFLSADDLGGPVPAAVQCRANPRRGGSKLRRPRQCPKISLIFWSPCRGRIRY